MQLGIGHERRFEPAVIELRKRFADGEFGNALVLELMHFPDELADAKDLPIPDKVQVGKKELTMAGSLIEGMTDKWEAGKYHDEYKQALLKLIEEKVAAGGKELPVEKGGRTKPTKVIDLVSVLQQSLNQFDR